MTPQEFTIWLKGFLDAITQIENHHIAKIKDTLKNIVEPKTITPNVSNEKLVPWSTICSCNPNNGGSGICGCIMGNKLVPKLSKTNIYTTTSDNMPFNWKYENSKQILND